ncbi:hypothetical protein [Hymenobacter elongatus]|uniref:Uncharacterized protein n=1 Tax=Hymenobacter elongatus TaxID=877208 RepID=A0A4Z0PK19_9BACT|nr:hypothetical protein [Hymenobacter elongatus]TGE15801.1 hypothetical protein E5J99_11425 [Hymenobacter elongatus]
MVYASLNSFCETEVSSALAKQQLLNEIAAGQKELHGTLDVEYNVYQLVIRFKDNHVELWDTMMHYDKDQEPYTTTLKAFLKELAEYVPGTFPAEYVPSRST